jgi:hypothetical protein
MSNQNTLDAQEREDLVWVISILAAILCLVFLIVYLVLDIKGVKINNAVLVPFVALIGCLFFPFLSRLKIGDLLEIERLQAEVKVVKDFLLRGEVVRTNRGERFYIDKEGRRYSIRDDATAHFLQTNRGEIPATDKDLEEYPLRGEMESVLTCKLLKWNERDLFALLNGNKYYISSWGYVADWHRSRDEFESCDDRGIAQYPTER